MKRILCWATLLMAILSFCCCAPAAPALAEQPPETAAPTATLTPAPTPSPTAVPTPTPTPTPAPTLTPTPAPTPTPTPTPEPTPPPAPRDRGEIVEELVYAYAQTGVQGEEQVQALLQDLSVAYPEAGQRWTLIMDRWRALEEAPITIGVLPDGLPDTDELCIVALGYRLNPNGSMRDELKERLRVVEKSAKKYPNAWVVCTGGGTASRKKGVTEAGRMSSWLKKHGVSKKRIITEKKSRSTVQNAQFTLDILLRDHPEIKYLAIVTSDYHIKSGALCFEAEAILRAGPGEAPRFTVIAGAACKTSREEQSVQYRASCLVELAKDEAASPSDSDQNDGETPLAGQTGDE